MKPRRSDKTLQKEYQKRLINRAVAQQLLQQESSSEGSELEDLLNKVLNRVKGPQPLAVSPLHTEMTKLYLKSMLSPHQQYSDLVMTYFRQEKHRYGRAHINRDRDYGLPAPSAETIARRSIRYIRDFETQFDTLFDLAIQFYKSKGLSISDTTPLYAYI
jgi:hypothetical protein